MRHIRNTAPALFALLFLLSLTECKQPLEPVKPPVAIDSTLDTLPKKFVGIRIVHGDSVVHWGDVVTFRVELHDSLLASRKFIWTFGSLDTLVVSSLDTVSFEFQDPGQCSIAVSIVDSTGKVLESYSKAIQYAAHIERAWINSMTKMRTALQAMPTQYQGFACDSLKWDTLTCSYRFSEESHAPANGLIHDHAASASATASFRSDLMQLAMVYTQTEKSDRVEYYKDYFNYFNERSDFEVVSLGLKSASADTIIFCVNGSPFRTRLRVADYFHQTHSTNGSGGTESWNSSTLLSPYVSPRFEVIFTR